MRFVENSSENMEILQKRREKWEKYFNFDMKNEKKTTLEGADNCINTIPFLDISIFFRFGSRTFFRL